MIRNLVFCVSILTILQIMSNKVLAIDRDQPIELGNVNWIRSYDEALQEAAISKKPILILFQEVPGCATCTKFGKEVLSHPLLVDAIEQLFVPLAIFNNNKGDDARILELFNEPSWNNPVVRIVNGNGESLVERLHNNWSPSGLASTMLFSLKNANGEAPAYLELMLDDFLAKENGKQSVTLAMHCFWTGEKQLATIDGVVSTKAGFMNGREVVSLEYNPQVVEIASLLNQAAKLDCTDVVYMENIDAGKEIKGFEFQPVSDFRLDKEPKYYLGNHATLSKVALTPIQSMRIKRSRTSLPTPSWNSWNILNQIRR